MGFQRRPRVADRMTPEMVSFFELGQQAEWNGDLEQAYAFHRGIPAFDRGRHRSMLRQVTAYADSFTPWLWARWAVYAASRCEATDTGTAALRHATTREVIDLFHCDAMDDAFQRGGDPIQVAARVAGESWAYRQLCIDTGVLASFMAELAGGALVDAGPLVSSWVETPVKGYEILPRDGALRVRDLESGDVVAPLDLGAGCGEGREKGLHVLGRLVPTGEGDRLMFDTRPLAVDRRTAQRVARDGWDEALIAALEDGRMREEQLMSEDLELASDVPELSLLAFGTPARELPRVMDQLRSGRDEVSRAAFRILRDASERPADAGVAPHVAASVCNVEAFEQSRRMLVRPGMADWEAWAQLAAGPARARLLELGALSSGDM